MANFQDFMRGAIEKIGRKLQHLDQQQAKIDAQYSVIEKMCGGAPSITEEIDSIPGRRIFYNLNGEIEFDITDNNRRGQPVNFLVSQDGPFIQTHFPMAVWRPSAPVAATNFGLWRPVSAWPLPSQGVPASAAFDLNEDIISISYEMVDGGSQRNMQNLPTPPVLSTPSNLVPLPVPTLFTPNTTIQFFPTYNSIRFSDGVTPPTEGILSIALIGYRIVNM